MLRDRGYEVGVEDLGMSLATFRQTYGDAPDRADLALTAMHTVDESAVQVHFPSDPRVNSQTLQRLSQIMVAANVVHAILVVPELPTTQAGTVQCPRPRHRAPPSPASVAPLPPLRVIPPPQVPPSAPNHPPGRQAAPGGDA